MEKQRKEFPLFYTVFIGKQTSEETILSISKILKHSFNP